MHGVLCRKRLELLSSLRLGVLALLPVSPSLQSRGSVVLWLEETNAVFPLLLFPRVDLSHGGVEELF